MFDDVCEQFRRLKTDWPKTLSSEPGFSLVVTWGVTCVTVSENLVILFVKSVLFTQPEITNKKTRSTPCVWALRSLTLTCQWDYCVLMNQCISLTPPTTRVMGRLSVACCEAWRRDPSPVAPSQISSIFIDRMITDQLTQLQGELYCEAPWGKCAICEKVIWPTSVTDTFNNDKKRFTVWYLRCRTDFESDKTSGRGKRMSVGDRWAVGEGALMSGICLWSLLAL